MGGFHHRLCVGSAVFKGERDKTDPCGKACGGWKKSDQKNKEYYRGPRAHYRSSHLKRRDWFESARLQKPFTTILGKPPSNAPLMWRGCFGLGEFGHAAPPVAPSYTKRVWDWGGDGFWSQHQSLRERGGELKSCEKELNLRDPPGDPSGPRGDYALGPNQTHNPAPPPPEGQGWAHLHVVGRQKGAQGIRTRKESLKAYRGFGVFFFAGKKTQLGMAALICVWGRPGDLKLV